MYSQAEVEEIKKQVIQDNNKQMILEFAKNFDKIIPTNICVRNQVYTIAKEDCFPYRLFYATAKFLL